LINQPDMQTIRGCAPLMKTRYFIYSSFQKEDNTSSSYILEYSCFKLFGICSEGDV